MITLVKNSYFLFSIFFLCLTTSCNKESLIINKSYPNVTPELWPYFQKFEQAAADRCLDIDLTDSGLQGTIKNINFVSMVGLCSYDSIAPREIIIDQAFWARASNSRKEMIVFHELGHCYLRLEHREESHSNGACKSIMRSGFGNCMDMYNLKTREDYLDELFY